jgi:hypothetical protein
MTSFRNPGRVAGFLYLLLAIVGPVRLMYIPSKLIVSGNATATANNISVHELLFRLGIVSDLLTALLGLAVGLTLYQLFKGVDKNLAALMVILGALMVTPIYFLNTVNDAAALTLVHGADFLSAFDQPQRNALAMLFLRLHYSCNLANEIFWGLWLIPLAILTYRSRFLPRFLGVWLVVNGLAYVIASFTGLLLPRYEDTVTNIIFPALTGEVAFMLWLLIKGVKAEALTIPLAVPAA